MNTQSRQLINKTGCVFYGKFRLILITLFSAILLPLALPNELFKNGIPVLGFFCLSPFFIALSKSPSYKFASLLGMIFAAFSTYITYYWLQFFGEYTLFTIGGVVIGYMIYFSLLAPFLRGLAIMYPRRQMFVLAIGWAYYEFLKSSGFLAFPWALLPHTMHEFLPLIQFTDITGIWGLSFLMALINSLIAVMLMNTQGFAGVQGFAGTQSLARPQILAHLPLFSLKGFLKSIPEKSWAFQGAFVLALTLIVGIYGVIRFIIPIPVEKTIRVLLIQQNRDPWISSTGNYEQSIVDAENLTLAGLEKAGDHKPDIIAWSETSFQNSLSRKRLTYSFDFFPEEKPFFPFVQETGIYFLVGAPHAKNDEEFDPMNSAVLLSPDAEVMEYYGKQHPVPFVESIPFWEVPAVREFCRKVIGIYGIWELGSKSTVFRLPLKDMGTISFSSPICFEDVFPDLCRKFILNGAEVWINLTNVSWSKTESAELQMFIASKFRAIENRRVLIRSTNSGVTSIIDAKGRVLGQLPLFTPAFLLADVPVMKESSFTFYTLFGDYFAHLLGLAILALCIIPAIRGIIMRRKDRHKIAETQREGE